MTLGRFLAFCALGLIALKGAGIVTASWAVVLLIAAICGLVAVLAD